MAQKLGVVSLPTPEAWDGWLEEHHEGVGGWLLGPKRTGLEADE